MTSQDSKRKLEANGKRTEQALSQTEELYRHLFNAISEACVSCEVVFGADGSPIDYRFLDVNPSYERLSGFSREQVVGRLRSEIPIPKQDEWIQRYGEARSAGRAIHYEHYQPMLGRHVIDHA